MEEDSPPAKKLKVDLVKDIENSGSRDDGLIPIQLPKVDIAESPVTKPMLMPEMWSQAFEFLSPDDLQTVMNSTPEWNRLLHSQKPKILFPKVLACLRDNLSWEDALSFRMVSKACRTGVEVAIPEIRTIINATEIAVRAAENMARAAERIRARILLGMRREARNREREAEGLPVQEFRDEDEDEPVQEDEFNDEEIQAYLARRFQAPRQ